MFKKYENIKKIYMVSSVIFSMVPSLFELETPLKLALGLAVDSLENKKETKDELEEAVESAFKKTYNKVETDTERRILEELNVEEIVPDNLNELIKRTEIYRNKYCTGADIKEILSIFEKFFLEEVIRRQHLNRLYIMNAQRVTLEKLEQINDIMVRYGDNLNQVKNDISKLTRRAMDENRIYLNCFNSIVYTMVAMLIFLILGIITSNRYSGLIVLSAIISCVVSDFLMVFVRINESILIAIVLTISCFWILIWSIDMGNTYFILTTIFLIIGKFVSLLLKKLFLW